MKSIILSLLLFIATDLLFSQGTFIKTFPTDRNVQSLAILQATDGNFLLYGRSSDPGINNCFLLKAGPGGDSLWTRVFASVNQSGYLSKSVLLETADQGFSFVTEIAGNSYIIHTSQSGDSLWSATFPHLSYSTLQATSDEGYILCGLDSIRKICLVKTNSAGNEIWRKEISKEFPSGPGGYVLPVDLSVKQTNDDGFIISGNKIHILIDPPYPFLRSSFFIRANSNGDTLWTKTIDNLPFQRITGIQLSSGNGFTAGGSLDSISNTGRTHTNGYVISVDGSGNTLWTKSIGGSGNQEFFSFEQTEDGGYIGCGYNDQVPGYPWNSGLYLVRLNADGDTLWTKLYPGNIAGWGDIAGFTIRQTTDHGYLVLLKTDALGNVYPQGVNDKLSSTSLSPFPNPTTGWLFLNPPGNFTDLEISDMMGNVILKKKTDPANPSTIKINLTGYPAGVYLLRMKNEFSVVTGKVLITNQN
ncbi:MAG: T9SS type A sorting domain-containing protein [Methanoregula sp.]|nr:T9SS type A sorting domain-containing protein [Methanoregula sp.]